LRRWSHHEHDDEHFSPEVRARAVRMVFDHESEHRSRWAAVSSIAGKFVCTAQSLSEWVKKAEVDSGVPGGLPTEVAEKAEGAGAGKPGTAAGQRDPAQGERLFCDGGARPPVQAMIAVIGPDLIRDHREAHGVEPICNGEAANAIGSIELPNPIALSTYHDHVAKRHGPSRPSARSKRDEGLQSQGAARVRGELPRLRRAQGPAAVQAGHDHAAALGASAPASDARMFWGSFGCGCWAV
jgi:transposase-like protein